ncbi:MAG: hypothetical protein V9G19_06540 [Tetrasphaera sp.]
MAPPGQSAVCRATIAPTFSMTGRTRGKSSACRAGSALVFSATSRETPEGAGDDEGEVVAACRLVGRYARPRRPRTTAMPVVPPADVHDHAIAQAQHRVGRGGLVDEAGALEAAGLDDVPHRAGVGLGDARRIGAVRLLQPAAQTGGRPGR